MTPTRSSCSPGAPRRSLVSLFLLLALLLTAGTATAVDWAQWRGVHQNGVSDMTGLIDSWSQDGTNLRWRNDFTGRSTPAVFDGRVCANGRVGEDIQRQAVVACFDADTGEERWARTFLIHNTTVPWNRVGWGSVAGDAETGHLYVQIVDGSFVAFDRDGNTAWSWRLGEDVGRMSGYGGRTHTPIVDEDRVIISVIGSNWGQGPPRHRYYAFDKRTGDILWIYSSKHSISDANTYSIPVITVVNGRRLLVGGGAGGWVHAVDARTGEGIWTFQLSQRGLNSSAVADGKTVYISHSEENIDTGTMGRVIAIDATGTGDVTKTHERWRVDALLAGFVSPVLHDGVLYVGDNSANLHALDVKTGEEFWEYNYGTVGKGSPVLADGKIYLTETNGNIVILKRTENGVEPLDKEHLEMSDGRYAEIYGSVAIAYGQIYFTSEEGIYALGDKSKPLVSGAPATCSSLNQDPAPADAQVAALQVVPAEVVGFVDEDVTFSVRAFDAMGRAVPTPADLTWSLSGVNGGIDGSGKAQFTAAELARGVQTGFVDVAAGDLKGRARVRLANPLPWSENFDDAAVDKFLSGWLGGGKGAKVREIDDRKVLFQPKAARNAPRAAIYMGPSSMSGYTIQADVKGSQEGRRKPDVGLINNGYTVDLQGNHQRIEVRSWASERRMAQRFDFEWSMDAWYTIQMRVDVEPDGQGGEKAVVRAKIWPQGETPPAEWTVTVDDPLPIREGAPGLYAFSPIPAHFDNVKVFPSAPLANAATR
ncbi:MAG: PQQ-binding-like beta-propeller repeat protein [Acidobacteriota bacterium]